MDKYEYKHLAEQIQYLIDQKEYAQAAEIADQIDWRRVPSVMMLGTISDLYRINNRYEDARDIMLMAYERKPENRQVCYSLCELYIKTGEMANAVEFYKEYAQLAPKDPGQYILQYEMYEANNVSLEERAEVLENLKKCEYQEKWMYELAYLYHRMELETKCVEVCDELILWFGSGKYVNKALELKRLHAPLTPEQQEKYENRFRPEPVPEPEEEPEPELEPEQEEIQEEELPGEEPETEAGQTKVYDAEEVRRRTTLENESENLVKTVDVGQYNTMNLQAEIAAGVKEVLGSDSITRALLEPMLEPDGEPQEEEYEEGPVDEIVEESEVYFGETGELNPTSQTSIADQVMEQMRLESLAAQEKLEKEAMTAQPPEPMAKVLTQESDGQIKLVIPEKKTLEKQITGQLSIEDIRAEWEKMKQESREKQEEEVRQHVLRQTGKMFTEFEEAMRDNILKQMEKQEDPSLYEMPARKEYNVILEESTWEDEDLPEEEPFAQMEDADAEQQEAEQETWNEADSEQPIEEISEGITEEISEEISESKAPIDELSLDPEEEPWENDALPGEEPQQPARQAEEAHGSAAVQPETAEGEESAAAQPKAATQPETAEGEEPAAAQPKAAEGEEPAAAQPETAEGEEPAAAQPKEAKGQDPAAGAEAAQYESEEGAEEDNADVRSMTEEETELYGDLVRGRSARAQLVKAIDSISMAAYAGNAVVTGEENSAAFDMAKKIVREIKLTDSNFTGTAARISGTKLNKSPISDYMEKLKDGSLIIDKASKLSAETVANLYKYMQQDSYGLLVVLIDTKKNMNEFLAANEKFAAMFSAFVDVQPPSNEALAEYALEYAREQEFSIDDLGMLALHTRIDELQTAEHAVTRAEIEELMEYAMENASRKTLRHFFDLLFGRRYDSEDMMIITEKDFV